MSMITAATWVPRGQAAPFPAKYHVDDQELARISKLAQVKLEDAKDDLKNAENGDVHASSEGDSDEEATGVELPKSKEYYLSALKPTSFLTLMLGMRMMISASMTWRTMTKIIQMRLLRT